jgi:DNA repair protein RecN (Recombination protein N)
MPQRDEVIEFYAEMVQARRALDEARRQAATAAEQAELLRFQAAEIEAANLTPGEDEGLEAERGVLRSAEKLLSEAGEAYQHLYAEEGAAVSQLAVARRRLEDLTRLDARLEPILRVLEPALFQAEEAATLLRDYLEAVQPDPARLEWVEERLAAIRALKRKYGDSIEAVLAAGKRAKEELASLEQAEELIAALAAEFAEARRDCWRATLELSGLRAMAAELLSRGLTFELRQVGMPQAEFRVRLDRLAPAAEGDPLSSEGQRMTPRGREEALFLVAPNPGEGLKPLSRIASGGELSRVMLGLKTVLSGGGETLVFDEVDAGLGGAVAEVVGRKLRQLAAKQQVVCITHLPQIACFAERHFAVSKEVVDGRTLARVRELDDAERLEEVARMLGGVTVTEKARQHAREMIKSAAAGS